VGAGKFHPSAARRIFTYAWPRNIRELERCLQTSLALAGDQPIGEEHLPHSLLAPPAAPAGDDDDEETRLRAQLSALHGEHGGNVSAVARVLGKAPTQIHRWIKRYGLKLEQYRRA
jgi:transcriptional regulator of acetoin/glycerol metabolism